MHTGKTYKLSEFQLARGRQNLNLVVKSPGKDAGRTEIRILYYTLQISV